jgi:hypothetical protein
VSIPGPAAITRERVQRFGGTIGGFGLAAGIGFGRLLFGDERSDFELYAISAFTVLMLLLGGLQLRRWPPRRF